MVVFAVATREFLGGTLFPLWDADGLFGPYYMLIADLVRHGKLLWWNPWANGGEPDFIDLQYGAHSPVVLVLAWLFGPTVRGYIAYWFSFWLVFGIGILALARHWRAPAWAGVVVALGLMFSGFFVGNAEHTPVLFAWVWLPLVLYRLDVSLTQRRWSAAVQAGVLLGLSALGGYPAILFTHAVFLTFWVVVRVFCPDGEEETVSTPRGQRSPLAFQVRTAVAMLAITGVVTAVVVFPAFFNFFHEGKGFTVRADVLSRKMAVESNALHPLALLTFASPYLATLPWRLLWKYTDISSCGVYVGGLVFSFALFSLLFRPRSRFRWALLGGAAIAFMAALGHDLPVRGWIYDWVPPTRFFRHPSWFRAYPMLIFGILALHGARDYAADPGDRARARRLTAATAVSAIVAALAYAAIIVRVPSADRLAGDVHFFVAWILPALTVPWLAAAPPSRRAVWLAVAFGSLAASDAVLNANLATTLGVRGASFREAWADVERRHRSATDLLQLDGAGRTLLPAGPYNNKHFLTREAALQSYSGLTNPYHERWIREPVLVAAATSSDRFWYSSNPVRVALSDDAFSVFLARAREMGRPPLVLHTRAAMTVTRPTAARQEELELLRAAPAAEKAAIDIKRYFPDSFIFDFQAPRDGWLMVTDRWTRGWTSRVNGAAVTLEGAGFIFRGVPVHAGPNRVELEYRPPGYPWLPFTSWFTVAVLVAISFWWRAASLRVLRARPDSNRELQAS
jgi:hypothetical protein